MTESIEMLSQACTQLHFDHLHSPYQVDDCYGPIAAVHDAFLGFRLERPAHTVLKVTSFAHQVVDNKFGGSVDVWKHQWVENCR